jgi:formylglycine-generating enzyme required for sulfatase activity
MRTVLPRLLPAVALLGSCALLLPAPPALDGAPAPAGGAKRLTNSIGMKLVLIPSGKFTMGSPNDEFAREGMEGPRHVVEITRPFYLGAYEVTQAEYQKVTGTNPCTLCAGGKFASRVSGLDTSNFPVETVDWNDCRAFCEKLSALPAEKRARRVYRLPTEAQWEYACRAGAREYAPFAFGKSLSSHQANFNGNISYGGAARGPSLDRACKVGSYKPNAWGLYDMHGNVWEWTADWYESYSARKGVTRDPKGAATGSQRIFRGGSWTNEGSWCRSAKRYPANPDAKNYLIGFRVVCVVGGR